MIFQNISKRKVLLLIINALVSVLLISCILFLYHYLPTSTRSSIFTVEKTATVGSSGIHISKAHNPSSINGSPTRSVIVANVKSPYTATNRRLPPSVRVTSSSEEEAIDDTIYIDNDSYGDESYDINSNNNNNNNRNSGLVTSSEVQQRGGGDDEDDDSSEEEQTQQKVPMSVMERVAPRSPSSDEDLYYENYDDETDDEDIVSSGDGKIVLNVKKSTARKQQQVKKLQTPPPEPANYIENVYSVSSEIVSNLKSQYNVDDASKQQQQQINKSEDESLSSSNNDSGSSTVSDDEDIDDDDEPSTTSEISGKRLIGNNKKLAERSRQLILCRSANMGELCRMLN